VQRVALWVRWSWRDLRARIVQVAAVAAVVALGTGIYAGLSSTSGWRRSSYDASYRSLAVHDLRVTLTSDTYVPARRLHDAIAGTPNVADVETRLVAPTQVDASTGGRTILVPGRLIGVDLTAGRSRIDRLEVRAGRALGPEDRGRNRVALDVHFAEHHHLPAQGTLRLSGAIRVEYVAHVLSPEYFMVSSNEGTMHAEANFAVMWASTETVGRLTGRPGRVNDAVVRLRDDSDRRASAAALEARLRVQLPNVAATVTPIDADRSYDLMYKDIDGDQRLFTIFSFLVLGGAAFAAFNLVSRIVEAQRREIGIGMSLGVPPPQIAIRPALVGLQVALLGAALGVAIGFGVAALVLNVMQQFMPLPDWHTEFSLATYARGWMIGLVVPFVATLIPVARAIRVDPIDAIRTGPSSAARTGLAPLIRRLTVGNSIRQMPVRNVLRAPRRTLLTALAIGAAIATLVGVIGLVDSFVYTIDTGESAVLGERADRLSVNLSGFALRGSPELRAITQAPGVGRAEPGLQVMGTMRHDDDSVDALVRLLPFDSRLWVPPTHAGRLDTTSVGIVISEKASRDLHAGVGDELTLRHPLRQGLGYRMVSSQVRVEAIHDIPYRFMTFMDTRDATLMNLDGVYNVLTAEPEPGTSVTRLQRTLFETPGVSSVQAVRDFADSIRNLLAQMLDILRVIEGAVLVLALLIAFNSSSISADERAREHATMFAYGVPVGRVLANTVIESVIVGALGTAIGIGLGHAIVGYITRFMLPGTLPDVAVDPAVSSVTIWTAVVLGIVAVSIAPLFTVRRMRRMDIPATLRVVE
jgi:putative ABC transport system permease protein